MPTPRGLVQQLDQSLHRSGLLPRKGRLLVAVSGGADSVALLRLLHRINQSSYWGWTLMVAHVDHGIRGRASREDAKFVRGLAASLRLKCFSRALRLGAGVSEDAARRGRLRALASQAKKCRAAGVVMAHHADDQAQTMLLRMFRGCGLEGLAGMAAVSRVEGLTILRPLLEIRRSDLHAWLESIHQPWREDATNLSDVYLRNRLRHHLMPVIESLWPQAVSALCRLARVAGEASAFIEDQAAGLLNGSHEGKMENSIPRALLQSAPPIVAAKALRHWIEQVGGTREIADFERICELLHLVETNRGGRKIELGRGLYATLNDGRLYLRRQRSGR